MSKTFTKSIDKNGTIYEIIVVTSGKLCSFWCGGKDETKKKCDVFNTELKMSNKISNGNVFPYRCNECNTEFVDS